MQQRRHHAGSKMIEQCEPRHLLAALTLPLNPVNPRPITNPTFEGIPTPRAIITSNRKLEIIGSPESDEIELIFQNTNGANRLLVRIGERERVIKMNAFNRIDIIGDDNSRDLDENDQFGPFPFRGPDSIEIFDEQGVLAALKRKISIFGDNRTATQFDGADTISGSSLGDTIDGGGGIDIINGLNGNDSIEGGGGADTINGGNGNDTISSGAADAGTDINNIRGGRGNDSVIGGQGIDIIDLSDGNDFGDGKFGNDIIRGGIGDDFITGGNSRDIIYGEDGNDTIFGDLGESHFKGVDANSEADSDEIFGGDGNDSLWGEFGDDSVSGAGGADTLLGQYGRDELSGGAGPDYLDGHEDDDALDGGPGRDTFNMTDSTPSGQTDFKRGEDDPTLVEALLTFQPGEQSAVR